KSHRELATEVVKLRSELHSDTISISVPNKRGTTRTTAKEVLSADNNTPQSENSHGASIQPTDKNSSDIPNILVGIRKRPSRLME
ncbi:hypothetical protein GcM3_152012, partial [Golovinomyces cichoracearum]